MSSGNLYENSSLLVQHQSPNAVTGTRLHTLFERGDIVSIENGLLKISQADGHQLFFSPFCAETQPLTREILTQSSQVYALEYIGCSTGFYGQRKSPGLTLQFLEVVSRNDAYTIFNVHLTRQRNTKAGRQGQPLPKGHFWISKGHQFFGFWESTPLPIPRRLSSFHDYMGKLGGLLFTGRKVEEKGARLDSGSVRPLSISAAEIRATLMPDNARTADGQTPDNSRTKSPDISCTECQQRQGLQPDLGTSEANHGKAVIRKRGYRDACIPHHHVKRPEDQSIDEWTEDLCRPCDENW